MPPLKEIPFGTYLTWCPAPERKTVLAIGRHGTGVDFIDLDLGDTSRRAFKNPASVTLPDGLGVNGISWTTTPNRPEFPYGLLALGTDAGTVRVWNPETCLGRSTSEAGSHQFAEDKVLVATCQSSSEPATCVAFNTAAAAAGSTTPPLLGCGHADGSVGSIPLGLLSPQEKM